jgi:surfactin synthase thioesterase subunit
MSGSWLLPEDPAADASARLVLFHHSGGSAAFYGRWPSLCPPDVAVQRVQLPGRLDRAGEQPYTESAPLVATLVGVLAATLDDRPCALFGHSMGALLAYRTAVGLERAGYQGPALLGVSGWAPDGFGAPAPAAIAGSDDDEVLAAARALGSLPSEVEQDPGAARDLARLMRADAGVVSGYADDAAMVGCPIAAYTGLDDPLLGPGAMRSWAGRTPEFLGVRAYPGDHFYLRGHAEAVAADLALLIPRSAAG